ncbi:MAG: nicotinate (nicotinamide) nucleotide adenylyltransferase [Candidatus Methanomethylophilaceae archaeon]|nr:nicotinate (nicotinamide) nucleotide adenylyltransferase [Candidatus Methanomethylophilaceae archaeon]
MRTAVYGGTFNPPHLGHEHVVAQVIEQLRPDRFLIIPNAVPPHKRMEEGSPTVRQRMEMCAIAFAGYDVEISDLEARRRGNSYTYRTLEQLHRLYPEDTFFLIIGSDSLLTFRMWKRYERILDLCIPVVLCRDPADEPSVFAEAARLTEKTGREIRVLPFDPVVLSSTEIRETGRLEGTVSPGVLTYIREHRLYGTAETGTMEGE